VTDVEFLAMRDRDEFAEWAEVHGHRYGTPAKALESALERGLDVILDIDTHGARQLRQRYPEAVSIFIMAPSMKELEARLRSGRATRPSRSCAVSIGRARRSRRGASTTTSSSTGTSRRPWTSSPPVIQAERWRTSRLTLKFPDVEVPE